MKIRNGFVSNSSSSSFIVRMINDALFKVKKENIASKEDIKLLEEYGFHKSNRFSPFSSNENIPEKDDWSSMRYWVSCNQDEIIYFLLKNNIPFKASVHYDNYYISYKKDSKYMLKFNNFGISCEMYGEDEEALKEIENSSSYEKIPVKQFLKENKWLENEQ